MKNIHAILSEIGIAIPEDKKTEFDKAVAENYKTTAEFDKKVTRLTEDLTAEKKRADEAAETLKGFEGKDFDAITKERDEWKKKHDDALAAYKQEQEDREYNEEFEQAASAAKCIDVKALSAHLDHEALRKSHNRKADIEAAISAQRAEKGYLFEDDGGKAKFTDPKKNNPNGATEMGKMTMADYIAARKK